MTSPSRSSARGQSTQVTRNDSPSAAIYFYRSLTFAAAADTYVRAYREQADSWTTHFLLGRALELALKAILRADGMPAKVLAQRRYGHNLCALVQECRSRSIEAIDPNVPDSAWGLQRLSEAYNTKELEYQEHGYCSGPTPHLLRRLVHFAIELASVRALAANVRTRLLSEVPSKPGLTLDAIEAYD